MLLRQLREHGAEQCAAGACKQHADPERVRSLLRQSDDMLVAAWCVTHGQECRMVHSDTRTTGNTCTDHSSFGERCGMAGPHTRIFYVWAAVMRQVRPKVIIAENVTQFGLQPYERELGDICACVRTVVSAAEQAMNLPLCWQRLAYPLGCLRSKTTWLCNQCCACLIGCVFGGKRNRAGGRAGR